MTSDPCTWPRLKSGSSIRGDEALLTDDFAKKLGYAFAVWLAARQGTCLLYTSPLSSALETGDFVEVMTSQASHGPSRDWLNIVKTSEAKAKIRAWLKKEEREENVIKGKEMLTAEAKKAGYTMAQLTKADILEPVFKRYSLSSLDDLYATIGFGGLSTLQLLNRLAEEYKKQNKACLLYTSRCV